MTNINAGTKSKKAKLARMAEKWGLALGIALFVGTISAIAVPGFLSARERSYMKSCQGYLTKIDGSKEQWSLENNKSPGETPAIADIVNEREGYLKEFPSCPSGGSYVIHAVGTDPDCTTKFPGHALSEVGLQFICDLDS